MARKKEAAANVGLDVEPPKETCQDRNCPFHGELPVRGTVLTGTVVSMKMQGTVAVEREHLKYIPKYERYEKRTSRYLAHLPPCMQMNHGDKVSIMECRPLSKRVSYVVIEKR
ncbi:MAG: 30S ribosomal protein S17 [Thermoplasmata archaeon]|nr:30S ribosomal protein S17 [Thermoplasmata archaeon]